MKKSENKRKNWKKPEVKSLPVKSGTQTGAYSPHESTQHPKGPQTS